MVSNDSSLSYRRIRAPKEHGATFHLPDSSRWRELWESNCLQSKSSGQFKFCDLQQLRETGRQQIINAAVAFTSAYRDVDFSDRDPKKLVLAGHQPTMFHPGVWYKNFVLGRIGNQTKAYAINLIVDNDNCGSSAAVFPAAVDGSDQYAVGRLNYDLNSNTVPFENRIIQNQATFESFGQRGCDSVSEFSGSPVLRHLWPHVLSFSGDGNLGWAIARGRHKLEEEKGLQTLELPISLLANETSFTSLAKEILLRLVEFREAYNQTTQEYRLLHRIRNRARPVPDLRQDNDWLETPFWIWQEHSPVRHSLFAKIEQGQLTISNRSGLDRVIDVNSSDQEFHSVLTSDICIRPKALITTMYSRLIASDLFIHGIGGSKYDQLTDEICRKFFRIELPGYLTVSGTFLLQQKTPPISPADIGKLNNQLRQIQFHPERFIEVANADTDAAQLIQKKMSLIAQTFPQSKRLARHHGIVECNEQLQPFVSDIRQELEARVQELQSQFATAKVLNSREFSFCFHDESLIDLLFETAETHFG